jgi:cell division transport system permease protein
MAQGRIKILKPKPNYTLSVVSVALVLFLIGLFAVIMTHSQSMVAYFKEQINVIIEIKDSTNLGDIKTLESFVDNHAMVKQSSIKFISKQEASESMKKEFGENYLLRDMPNPLFDAITFNVKSNHLNNDDLALLKSELMENYLYVNDVYFQETLIDLVVKNIEKASFIMLVIALLFVIVAITLIHNTVKLALYSNRILIKNMELVGASWGFIIKPYLLKAIWQGFLAGLIAIFLISIFCAIVWIQIPEVKYIVNHTILFFIALGLVVMGIAIMFVSTYRVIYKYLRMRTGDLL